MKVDSPLRYPGGKGRLSPFFKELMELEGLTGGWYCEPYAGGAGVALSLLFSEYVERIYINDLSPGIYAFWRTVLEETESLVRMIRDSPLTIDEWKRQRAIHAAHQGHSRLELGFATFYLNRTNRSGIIGTGGVIGGLDQKGKWRIDARFSREGLVKRIERIARFRDRISVTGMDAAEFLVTVVPQLGSAGVIYLDPPYFEKGGGLYEKSYDLADHEAIAALVKNLTCPWIVTYDDVAPIRSIYAGEVVFDYDLDYSAAKRRVGREVMFASRFFRDSLDALQEQLGV